MPPLIHVLQINGMKCSIDFFIEIVNPSSDLEGNFFSLSRKSFEETFSVLRSEKTLTLPNGTLLSVKHFPWNGSDSFGLVGEVIGLING